MFTKNLKLKILFLLFILMTTLGLRCKISEPSIEGLPKVKLKVWGVWENRKDLDQIIKTFQARHPNVTIEYRQFRYAEYEKQILNARANRQEPDIVFIHNTWLGDYLDKITPMPKSLNVTTVSMEGTIKKEQVIRAEKKSAPSLKKIKDTYLSVVYDDVVRVGKKKLDYVYSLPLYVDSLVMFYNKDILNNSGIIKPPATWEEFQQDVRLITMQDTESRIIQSGAALGTANNVERYFDIVSLLMMQSGAVMTKGKSISFNAAQKNSGSLGAQALRFYTDFASPDKDVYTWNKSMTNSLDEFAAGKVAFIFGYSYHLKKIRSKNPKLNFDVAKIPQISEEKQQEVNYASYWTPVVFNTSKNKDAAWNFIIYASSPKVVTSFLEASKRPPAIKDALAKYEEDFDLAPFVQQSLTAKSWYRGKRANAAEMAFQRMVDKALVAEDPQALQEAINSAASEIRNIY